MDQVVEMQAKAVRAAPVPKPTPRLSAKAVLQGTREVILVHGSEEYRLKLTASGKLILTK